MLAWLKQESQQFGKIVLRSWFLTEKRLRETQIMEKHGEEGANGSTMIARKVFVEEIGTTLTRFDQYFYEISARSEAAFDSGSRTTVFKES